MTIVLLSIDDAPEVMQTVLALLRELGQESYRREGFTFAGPKLKYVL